MLCNNAKILIMSNRKSDFIKTIKIIMFSKFSLVQGDKVWRGNWLMSIIVGYIGIRVTSITRKKPCYIESQKSVIQVIKGSFLQRIRMKDNMCFANMMFYWNSHYIEACYMGVWQYACWIVYISGVDVNLSLYKANIVPIVLKTFYSTKKHPAFVDIYF